MVVRGSNGAPELSRGFQNGVAGLGKKGRPQAIRGKIEESRRAETVGDGLPTLAPPEGSTMSRACAPYPAFVLVLAALLVFGVLGTGLPSQGGGTADAEKAEPPVADADPGV